MDGKGYIFWYGKQTKSKEKLIYAWLNNEYHIDVPYLYEQKLIEAIFWKDTRLDEMQLIISESVDTLNWHWQVALNLTVAMSCRSTAAMGIIQNTTSVRWNTHYTNRSGSDFDTMKILNDGKAIKILEDFQKRLSYYITRRLTLATPQR